VPTEGSAAFIVESLEHATHRNAPIYAEITGHGCSGLDDKKGMTRAFKNALKGEKVDVIFSAGKSTEFDKVEISAIEELDGDFAVTNTTGQIGYGMNSTAAV
jgi:3-oxoacyl-(acyl-carrier-protein) synthase